MSMNIDNLVEEVAKWRDKGIGTYEALCLVKEAFGLNAVEVKKVEEAYSKIF